MVYAGEVIENPLSGERITFLEVPGEVNGDLLRFDWTMPPRFYIPEHIHVHQEERHEIISGTLRGRVAGRERDYVEGERVTGPAGVPHAWRNPDEHAELRIVSELQPALGFEALLETYFAIGRDLRTCKKRVPEHVLRLAMLVDESRDEFYPTGMPMAVWKASLAPFSALARGGRMLGYEARYREESTRDRSKAVWSKTVGVIAAGLAGLAILALLRRRGKRRMCYGR
jgi:quercetin dioxygenase-like cupin family protein